jgi:hypothetical protein
MPSFAARRALLSFAANARAMGRFFKLKKSLTLHHFEMKARFLTSVTLDLPTP